MSKKCRAYSESKIGLAPPDNRKAFYAGWEAATALRAAIEQPRQWQGLTEEEIAAIVREAAKGSAIKRDGSTSERIARAIEAKLKEKNT